MLSSGCIFGSDFLNVTFHEGIEREHIVENQRDGVNGYVAPFLPMAVLVNGGSARYAHKKIANCHELERLHHVALGRSRLAMGKD